MLTLDGAPGSDATRPICPSAKHIPATAAPILYAPSTVRSELRVFQKSVPLEQAASLIGTGLWRILNKARAVTAAFVEPGECGEFGIASALNLVARLARDNTWALFVLVITSLAWLTPREQNQKGKTECISNRIAKPGSRSWKS